jgi:Predicted transmembrane protein 161AB
LFHFSSFTEAAFESFRLWCIMGAIVLRVLLMPVYLQAYLNMANLRLEEQKKEAGRITNKELQQKVAAVFYYLCVVSLQYLAPMLLVLYFSLVYKTLGNFQTRKFNFPLIIFGVFLQEACHGLVSTPSVQSLVQELRDSV